MGVTVRESSPIEFPELAALGLQVRNVEGDGNCLFRALSDQMKGNQKGHVHIRERVFRYMARNQNEFKDFFDVETVGGARRNTMRSTRGKGSARLPSQEERDKSWRQYVWKMRELGTWASQLEIKAFVKVYNMDVRIHLDGTTHGHHDCIKASDDSASREVLHIAYKNMHYQSVRNIAGPHTGPARTVAFGALPTPPTTPATELKVNDPNEFPALGSTKKTTPTPTPNINPGLAFLDAFDDDSSDDEKKPEVKSSAEKKPVEEKLAKKTTPAATSNRNPGLAFLDAFDDDSDSDDKKKKKPEVKSSSEKKPAETPRTDKNVQAKTEPAKKPVTKQAPAVQKKPVVKKPAEKKEEEEVKKGTARKVVRKPSRSPSLTSSKKRSHEDLSWLGSESDSSDEEEWKHGTASRGNKHVKLI